MTRNRPNRGWRAAGLALVGLLALAALVPAAAPNDPFALANAAPAPKNDPFAPANQAASPVEGKRTESTPAAAEGKPADQAKPKSAQFLSFKVQLAPATVRRGETVRLTLTGTPQAGYHTYPITQQADNPDQAVLPSKIVFDDPAGLQPLYPIRESDAEWEDFGTGPILVHGKEFTWSQDLAVPPGLTPGNKVLRFHVHLQVCDQHTCLPPDDHHFEVPLTVSDAPAVANRADAARLQAPAIQVLTPPRAPTRSQAPAAPPSAAPASAPPAEAPAAPMPDTFEEHKANLDAVLKQLQGHTGAAPAESGLLAFVLQGVFWGFVSLLTPCVFPMIPITVSFFLKQSEKQEHRPLTLAVVYTGTIVLVLTVAAVALLSFFRWLSVNPIMNFALGALFVYFALSLFGMYDIQLPSFLTNFTSAREGKGGVVGTVFMALTFTIVSFACVAPFLGGFGGTAAGSGITLGHRVLGGLAFAATFAAPFFLLALFPGLMRRLPRSGSWMNTVKVVMGFLEFAAALKFLRAGELVLLPRPTVFTYDLVLGVYVALAVLCGLYLIGVFRLPHDEPTESIGVPRFVFALGFLSLGLYLAPGLFKSGSEGQNQRPGGTVYAWVDSFLLPEPSEGKGELASTGNLKAAVDEARAAATTPGADGRKLVFLDFTGKTCTNCSLNERNVFPNPEIKDLLKRYRLVKLYTDEVPDHYYSPAVQGQFRGGTARQQEDASKANLVFQREAFGTEQLPLYVVLAPQPQGDIKVLGIYSEGKINDVAGFAEFLRKPLEETR